MSISRRTFVKGARGLAAADAGPARAQAQRADQHRPADRQDRSARLGRHRHGTRARHVSCKERNNDARRAARSELLAADTGGVPATARTKTQELVEQTM